MISARHRIAAALSAAVAVSAAAAAASAAPTSAPPKTRVTVKAAEAAARKKYPGTIVAKTRLENEDGRWQYSVMLRSGKTLREVMVGAVSGKVEDVEVTTAEKEAAEEKAESGAKAKKGAHPAAAGKGEGRPAAAPAK